MTLETGNYVGDLNPAYPEANAIKKNGDDHLRLIKDTLSKSFSGFTGPVLLAATEAQGTSTNEYVLTIPDSPASNIANMIIMFKATHNNTGGVSIKVGALSSVGLVTLEGTALLESDILNGDLCMVMFDGTNFVLLSHNNKANRHGDVYTGNHDWTAATLTMPQKVDTESGTANNLTITGTSVADTPPLTSTGSRIATLDFALGMHSPNFGGTPRGPTATTGSSGTQLATLDFVNATGSSAALPGQAGKNRALLGTNGTDAAFEFVRGKRYFVGQF